MNKKSLLFTLLLLAGIFVNTSVWAQCTLGTISYTVCAGATFTVTTTANSIESWSSVPALPFIATPGTGSATFTALPVGSVTIYYNSGSITCNTTVSILPGPGAAPILPGGTSALCVSNSLTLSDATPGGVWSSSNPSAATVSALGDVTGISGGTATITYSLIGTCIPYTTKDVQIDIPGALILPPYSTCL